MELYEQHCFTNGTVSNHDVAQQSFLFSYVEERKPVVRRVAAYVVAQLVLDVVHK